MAKRSTARDQLGFDFAPPEAIPTKAIKFSETLMEQIARDLETLRCRLCDAHERLFFIERVKSYKQALTAQLEKERCPQ